MIVSSGSKSLKSTAARLSVVSMVRGTSAFSTLLVHEARSYSTYASTWL